MTPTPRLRFVEREVKLDPFVIPIGNTGLRVTPTVQVLQQWWAPNEWPNPPEIGPGQWRDVPLEKEQP